MYTNPAEPQRPWYREPWPWLLMLMPGAALIGGIITAVIAVQSWDGLVADDYYKQGLGINRVLARHDRAEALRLTARGRVSDGLVRIEVDGVQADSLELALVHPGRSGRDQRVALLRTGGQRYEGRLGPVDAVAWRLALEDVDRQWRLVGNWNGRSAELHLAP